VTIEINFILFVMQIIMMSKKEKPAEIRLNHIYLTSIAECWHRIKIVEINEKEANVICVDNGDFEWIPLNDIYVCKPEFLTIAPQAFKVSLFGLEEFESGLNLPQLFEPLNYKSLVAEIMTTKDSFDSNKSKIKMILYDTSTDEDVNLNESLMNSILRSVSAPTLNQKESNQVIITNIGEDGIYCQVAKSSTHIQQLINNISKSDLAQYRGLYPDKSDKKKVYLIYDGRLKNWFRARLEKLMDGGSHWMFTIDHGYKTLVSVQDIYRLDKVSYVLSLYPSQVLKFGLYNVAFTEDNKKRLLGLLPTGRTALVSFSLDFVIEVYR
jgi:tudor domain-containing protein 1/4/6/7